MKYIFLFLWVPLSSQAVFQQLYQRYKQSNQVQALSKGLEINTVDLEFSKNRLEWHLDSSGNHTDSFLQALFAFQSNRTITDTFSVALNKQTFKYREAQKGHSHGHHPAAPGKRARESPAFDRRTAAGRSHSTDSPE